MRKLLLSLIACSTALLGYAADNKTTYVKGGDAIFLETNMDLEQLSKVTWFVGNTTDNRLGLENNEIAIPLEKFGFTFVPNGNGIYSISSTAKSDDEILKEEKESRKVSAHRLDYHIFYIARPNADKEDRTFDAAYFVGMQSDTLTYIHRYNTLVPEALNVVYGVEEEEVLVVPVNEKVKFNVEYKNGLSNLDVDEYQIAIVKETSEKKYSIVETLQNSKSAGEISFNAGRELLTDEPLLIAALAINGTTKDTVISDAKIELMVIPNFEIESLEYETISGNERYSKEFLGETEIGISVQNGDEVTLTINTNIDNVNNAISYDEEQDEVVVNYSWNKEGVSVPVGVIDNKDGKLRFTKYSKIDHDGIYNCIVTVGDYTKTVTFKVLSDYPTSNSVIDGEASSLFVVGNVLNMKNVKGLVRIYNINGKMVQTITATGGTSLINLNHPKGVYIITCESHTVKAVIR